MVSDGEAKTENGRQIYSFDVTKKSGKMINVWVSEDTGTIIRKSRTGR